MTNRKYLPAAALLIAALLTGLGCSVGTLLVRAPTPTIQPTKTPRPTFTFTPDWTPTLMPTLTATATPEAPTETPTPLPTDTPMPPTNTPGPPPPPADTPTPEPPTDTPTPEYIVAFNITKYIHDTGSPIQTRITAAIVKEYAPSRGHALGWLGAQLMVVDPQSAEHLSDPIPVTQIIPSTAGGDAHHMNVEMKISPYIPGHYKAWVVINGKQESPVVEFDMAASPNQYVHIDFFPPEIK